VVPRARRGPEMSQGFLKKGRKKKGGGKGRKSLTVANRKRGSGTSWLYSNRRQRIKKLEHFRGETEEGTPVRSAIIERSGVLTYHSGEKRKKGGGNGRGGSREPGGEKSS